jgi:hypothetical protein
MKSRILTLAALFATLAFASSAFAVTTLDTSTVLGGGTYSPSAKVTIKVIAAQNAYAATSQHLNGKKQFGTNNQDPKIYFKDAQASGPADPGGAGETFSGWSTY